MPWLAAARLSPPVISAHDLGVVALLGLVMAERHFPRPVIVLPGIFAVVTITLVLFAVFFSGS